MSIRIVRLGSPRIAGEGTRLGTVRRPPRGIPRGRFAADDWYDVWLPALAPAAATIKLAQAAKSPLQWRAFVRKYRSEMRRPEARHTLDLLVALSRDANFSLGCYCRDEQTCHRRVLRELLRERGATVAAAGRAS